jgi:hypothetical protein
MPTKSDDIKNSASKNFTKLPNFQVFTLERQYTTIHKGEEPDTSLQIHEFYFSIYLKCLKRTADIVWMYGYPEQCFSHNYLANSWLFAMCAKLGVSGMKRKTPTGTHYEAIMCFKFSSCM